jgi:serine/threonine-protein kinase HipA
MARTGIVFVSGQCAGIIEETEKGISFAYDEDYILSVDATPVSLTMPFTQKVYESRTMLPFFDGLVPEGWLLEIAQKNWKIEPRDRMGLLLAVCRDTIGNVTIVDAEDMSKQDE